MNGPIVVLEIEKQGGGRYELVAYPGSPVELAVLYSVTVTGKYTVQETWVGRRLSFPERDRHD